MTFKAINNTVGPDSLVPTLFIFDIYLYIITDLLFLFSQQQQVYTLFKTMSKLCKLKAQ